MGPSSIPGSMQPPRMIGVSPQLQSQSMTTIPPPIGQTGAPVAASSKIDPQQIPRPIPGSSVIICDTREGNQANPPPVFYLSLVLYCHYCWYFLHVAK